MAWKTHRNRMVKKKKKKKRKGLHFLSNHNAAMVLLLHYLSSRPFLQPQDLSDVRAQSKEADSTLQMD